MRKPTICIGENKAADQLCSNCTADQRLCFRYMDSTISLLLKSEILSFSPASVTVQASLFQTWSDPKLLVFSCTGSYYSHIHVYSPGAGADNPVGSIFFHKHKSSAHLHTPSKFSPI